MEYTGFIPIAAVFYAVFHPEEGTKIVYQVPDGAISTGTDNNDEALFNFDTVKNYVIPKPQLCNRLIQFKINNYRVIGFPVNIENQTYARNSFNFNFCFVFPYDVGDCAPYELAIKRIGSMFLVLEEQNFMMSKLDPDNLFYRQKPDLNQEAHDTPGHARTTTITLSLIELLISQIFSDLNNYSECCIPLDLANLVDIKLFPILPPPVNIAAFHVPIASFNLDSVLEVTMDPTMQRIIPHINGLNLTKRIAELADANYMITKQCLQHLMHYKCVEIIDIFQFSNIYACTNNISNFLKQDGQMAEDCQAYVVTDAAQEVMTASNTVSATPNTHSISPGYNSKMTGITSPDIPIKIPLKLTLFKLYRLLNQGMTVKQWYLDNRKLLENIDVRRFINFGIVRRIIYRVHSYPLVNAITRAIEKDEFYDVNVETLKKKQEAVLAPVPANRTVKFNKTLRILVKSDSDLVYLSDLDVDDDDDDDADVHIDSDTELVRKSLNKLTVDEDHESEMRDLVKMLKGFQHFDLICTELQKSRTEVEAMILSMGSYNTANG